MCRNIRTLFNFVPPVTEDEVHAAALQYVRKVSGTTKPSAQNQQAFEEAVTAVAAITHELMQRLTTSSPPRTRDEELRKAKERWEKRAARMSRS